MVGVAQLVECKIVILVVVGSIPIVHPIFRAPGNRRPDYLPGEYCRIGQVDL